MTLEKKYSSVGEYFDLKRVQSKEGLRESVKRFNPVVDHWADEKQESNPSSCVVTGKTAFERKTERNQNFQICNNLFKRGNAVEVVVQNKIEAAW